MEKERDSPFIVPAIMEAFEKIVDMTDTAVLETNQDVLEDQQMDHS